MRTFQDEFQGVCSDFDHKSLKEAIAEYILYQALIENKEIDIETICQELGLIES